MTSLIPDLAGLQEDPLAEYVLAVVFTAAPIRSVIQRDTSRHWQWMVRDPNESASFLWLSYAQPITDDTPAEIAARVLTPLQDGLVPDRARSVETSASILRFDAISLTITITRTDGTIFDQTLILEQGAF